MTETDYETYKGLFDAMVMTPYFPHPDLLIYLEGSFDDIVIVSKNVDVRWNSKRQLSIGKRCMGVMKTGLITLIHALSYD